MINPNPSREHTRRNVSCNICETIINCPEMCSMRHGIMSKDKVVPDYAKYGCSKYTGLYQNSKRKTTRPSKQVTEDLVFGKILDKNNSMVDYGITEPAFDSILARLRKKGLKIIMVENERKYKLNIEK